MRPQLSPFNVNIVMLGRDVRRCGRAQAVSLEQNARGLEAAQPPDGLRVGFAFEAGLHRLPVIPVERLYQRGGKDGLADVRIGSCNDDACAHAAISACAAARSEMSREIIVSSVLSVTVRRRRAVPSGTVGGRIARMS